MGVPLLYPWANRLSRSTFVVDGAEVSLPQDVPLFARDHNGLPIHGALPGLMEWDVVEATADDDSARLRARLEWDPAHEAFRLFPFPHRLEYEALLTEALDRDHGHARSHRGTDRSRSRSGSIPTSGSPAARARTPGCRCRFGGGWSTTTR